MKKDSCTQILIKIEFIIGSIPFKPAQTRYEGMDLLYAAGRKVIKNKAGCIIETSRVVL